MRDVNQLIFIIGTNDIHRVGADEAVRRISQTIELVRLLYPGVNIVWQLLQRSKKKDLAFIRRSTRVERNSSL